MKAHFAFAISILVLGTVACAGGAALDRRFAGPFDCIIRELADCEGSQDHLITMKGNKLRKYNRTTYIYSADIHNGIVLNDEVKLVVRFAIFGNGGWKNNYFVFDFGGICTAAQTYTPKLYKSMTKNIGVSCPVPPGNYSIKDNVVFMDFKLPSLPYGRFKTRLEGSKNGRIVGCKIVYVDIVPKSKKNH